jgi:hypothetical protein
MSGHAILDSCHNCGAKDVPLKVVSIADDCDEAHFHIHVVAACEECQETIWNAED